MAPDMIFLVCCCNLVFIGTLYLHSTEISTVVEVETMFGWDDTFNVKLPISDLFTPRRVIDV